MKTRRASGRPTIADVARLAGVGAITVSRAIRDPNQVSEELRNRIEEAIRELNYVPNVQAQILASGQSNVIAVLLPSLTNSVYADVIRGIYDKVAPTRFHIQIGNTRYSEQEEDRLVALFAWQRPAAMLLAGLDQSETTRSFLADAEFPIVQIMEHGPAIDMGIGCSHKDAARAAVTHLIDCGYRRIAFLGARKDPRMMRRRDGYREALAALPGAKPIELLTPEPSGVARGRALFSQLLDTATDIDAVACGNDDLALGALFECQARGIAVPEQMGIIGFNDLEMAAAAVPAISTVRIDRYEMGRRAIGMLLDRLEGKKVGEPIVDIGFDVIRRASTSAVDQGVSAARSAKGG
ncbi:LacI family DNA-binding transcriptional regulator [Ruegeria sediminis]|uniref:LacI family DNA-binding transcriptional regulator n=1 Tax=Ruegeria sediminis TaxID=2583820 RepID=A0ABY2X1A5_9RHOB|nr:LacI family DNA-binding transcriptional regulator [Ruegeria sediminis]TMV08461.1 LacI family DNA-binding transcriptional regulator [Ruegeria sediminis]